MDEFFPGLHLSEEGAGKSRGRRTRTLLLDAAHLHAHMARLDDDGHAERIERLLNAIADLHGQPLLHLQPAGIGLDDARDLRQPGDIAVRDIGYMALP